MICPSVLILCLAYVASCNASPPVRYVSHKNCNGLAAGTYISHPSNCHQFVRCHGLRSVLGDCPAGTFFNPAVYSCDRTRQSCREFKLEKLKLSEQKQMDALDGETEKGDSSQAAQGGQEAKELGKEAEKDAKEYEKEAVKETEKDTDQEGKKEEEKNALKESSSVLQDSHGVVVPPLSVTPVKPSLQALFGASSVGRPACYYWQDAQFPHPSNCEYYYNCRRGFLTVRRCYHGFGWDTRRQRCVPRREAVCQRR